MYGMLTVLLERFILCTFYLPALNIFVFTGIQTQDFQFEKEPESDELNHSVKKTL